MRILLISTWFPYPPVNGSKLRAYYLLRSLCEKHEVALISFQDAEIKPEWITHLLQYCQHVEVIPHNPFSPPAYKKATGWFSLKPSSISAAYSPAMTRQLDTLVTQWKPERIVALTYHAGEYALKYKNIPSVLDIDNLTFKILEEDYLAAQGGISSYRKKLAWQKFFRYEKHLYPQFDTCLTVSEKDRQEIIRLIAIPADRLKVVPNGVDLHRNLFSNYSPVPGSLVFNGSITYSPNLDGIRYFIDEILGIVQGVIPGTHLAVTGETGDIPFQTLCNGKPVEFTGHLDDIRPLIGGSWACVVPLRYGGGTRLKILEAMALGTPVITTTKGA